MQAKNHPTTSNATFAVGNVAQQKLQEEFADMKARFELNEDLTGLSVLSHKKQQDGSVIYNCVLQACHSKSNTEGEFPTPSLT